MSVNVRVYMYVYEYERNLNIQKVLILNGSDKQIYNTIKACVWINIDICCVYFSLHMGKICLFLVYFGDQYTMYESINYRLCEHCTTYKTKLIAFRHIFCPEFISVCPSRCLMKQKLSVSDTT